MKKKRKWKKRVVLGALAAGGAYAVVKTRNAYHGIMTMVENKNDDERKIMEKFARSYHYIGSDELFTGATVGAVCCSLRLEMQNARIEKDCEIELGCLMSSVVIFVPEQIHVVVDVEMKAGFTRWTIQNGLMPDSDGPTLYIHGTAHMSSVLVQTLPANAEAPEADPVRASSEPEEDAAPKAFAEETLPSGGPITDDEPEDTIRVIHIADLDDEGEPEEFAEPAEPATEPAEAEVAKTADENEPEYAESGLEEAEAESAEVTAETEAETAEVAAEEIAEEAEAEIAEVAAEAEPMEEAPKAEEESTSVDDADETAEASEEVSEPEFFEGDTVKAFDAIFEAAKKEAESAKNEEAEIVAPEELEEDDENSVEAEDDELEDDDFDEEDPDEEDDIDEEDLDEDDDFAGEDKRKRLSQDKIDAILDRLADEYEKRGGEE